MTVQHQIADLNTETNPEKDVKLDKAMVYLVRREHLLDSPISSQELVDFPAKLVVDCPRKRNVSKLGDGNDNWKNCCKNVDGKVRQSSFCRDVAQRVLDFGGLYDCIEEEEGIEDPRKEGRCLGNALLTGSSGPNSREREKLQGVPSIHGVQCHS